MTAGIRGIEYHLPDKIETNDDLGRDNPDWRMDWLHEKSGVFSRHVAGPQETAGDLGFAAASKLLARQLVDPKEIDFLLYCTQSPDYFLPSVGCILQHQLGLGKHTGAFDFNLGCSGWIYGLHLAKSYIETGAARAVLLVTADTYTKYINPRDRSTRPLFGDGAAATLIGPSEKGQAKIEEFVLGTDGAGAKKLIVPAGCFRNPHSPQTTRETTDEAGCVRSQDNLFMDGPAVFSFAITVVPRTISRLLQGAKSSIENIDWFVFHQANKFMLQNLAERCKIPWNKMVFAMEDTGNTVSSSIPIAVRQYAEEGLIRPGQKLCAIGFGVGYSWGACTLTW